jgi:hypothetical protein
MVAASVADLAAVASLVVVLAVVGRTFFPIHQRLF